MSKADLTDADLSGADLSGANLLDTACVCPQKQMDYCKGDAAKELPRGL